jgi:SH3 domain protein
MNRILMIVCCLFFLIGDVAAETVYISENIRMAIRTGPGSQYKVLETRMSGDTLEVIEPGPEWSRVQLQDGKDGWAPSRFLTTQIPCSLALKRLEQKYADLLTQSDAPPEGGVDLQAENEQLSSDLANLETRFATLSEEYESLKKDSADVVQLRIKYQDALTKLEEQSQKPDTLSSGAESQNLDSLLRWFLYGAGVLLTGFLLGWLTKPSKSRQSLLR